VLLTITTTARPATSLGYLLHKHPDRVQSFDIAAGTAYVCYPEATDERCTAALLLEIDPIELVRSGPSGEGFALGRYGAPEEISPAFVFLASDESNYITGQILCVDGGLVI